jgi:hypothetical protein
MVSPMSQYDLEKVYLHKKKLGLDQAFWDKGLSAEFCIALRSRDALLAKKIVHDFEGTKQISDAQLDLNNARLKGAQRAFFQTYLTDARSIGEFWSIFLDPTTECSEDLKLFDDNWYAQILGGLNSNQETALKSEITKVFKKHMNLNYWTSKTAWAFYLEEFLTFQVEDIPEETMREAFQYFLFVSVELQMRVNESGWIMDYDLYANPMKQWQAGRQSIKYYIRNKILALLLRYKFFKI